MQRNPLQLPEPGLHISNRLVADSALSSVSARENCFEMSPYLKSVLVLLTLLWQTWPQFPSLMAREIKPTIITLLFFILTCCCDVNKFSLQHVQCANHLQKIGGSNLKSEPRPKFGWQNQTEHLGLSKYVMARINYRPKSNVFVFGVCCFHGIHLVTIHNKYRAISEFHLITVEQAIYWIKDVSFGPFSNTSTGDLL